ncbi:MAG: hypothetical protein Q4B82_08805 [Alysiella sp.]|nr:hypothetical protein [Alysiella sp.]MDO4434659.1 hypothetical protein [Alysiella sp.]
MFLPNGETTTFCLMGFQAAAEAWELGKFVGENAFRQPECFAQN